MTRYIAIDWSGRAKGAGKYIWIAVVREGRLESLLNGRDRDGVVDYLTSEATLTSDLVVGFDFAFSSPEWFLRGIGCSTAPEFWEAVAGQGEIWLSQCCFPFWGRPGCKKTKISEHYRKTEADLVGNSQFRPKSFFQIGGAGAVGTGSIRGMPVLLKLRNSGFAIWPFDDVRCPVIIEIYPRILTGPVNKSSESERASYLSRNYPAQSEETMQLAASAEDAFDAAVSALEMYRYGEQIVTLLPSLDEQERVEGLIWRPNARSVAAGSPR